MIVDPTPAPTTDASPRTALDLAMDQALATVGRKLHEALTTTKFGMITVEVRGGQVYVGGGSTVKIENAQWTMPNGQ